jgi:hypothetical protein
MCKGAGTVPDEEAAACSSLAKALHPVPTPAPSSTLGLAVEPTLEPLALPIPSPESIGLPSTSTLTPYLPRLSVLLRNSTCLAEKPARGASNEDRMRLPGNGPEMGPLRLITEDEAEVGVAPPKEDRRLENRVIGCELLMLLLLTERRETWLIIPGVEAPETFRMDEAFDQPRFRPVLVPEVDILINPARSSSVAVEPVLNPRRCCSALPPVRRPTNALKPPPPVALALLLPVRLPAGRDSGSISKSNLGGGTAVS